MDAATSSAVREEHQEDRCMYCGAKICKWKHELVNGLERKVAKCENGHEVRIKVSKYMNIERVAKVHTLDW